VELEGRGVPAVVVGTQEFRPLALADARSRGVPDLPVVSVPHPIGGIPADAVTLKAEGGFRALLDGFRGGAAAGAGIASPAPLHSAPDDLLAYQEWILEQGWGDGLPVLPATPERVEQLLEGTRRAPSAELAVLPPRLGRATVETVAINAALAGAVPEQMPVIIAAIEAVGAPVFNLRAIQATTHPCSPLVIVNGPIAPRLGINAAGNALGQGARANAVIGRAVRLTLQNVGGARPGLEDRATQGHPGKYSYCMAENEAASPWESLAVERGFAADESTVTVCGAEGPHNINDHGSTSAEGILATVAGTVAQIGSNNIYLPGEPLIALGPEHAATVAASGWTKADLKRRLFEAARVPLSRFGAENREHFVLRDPERYAGRALDALVPIAHRWEDIMVIVAGGAGKHSVAIFTFGSTRSVTRRIDD
jgi:hypothetical protein